MVDKVVRLHHPAPARVGGVNGRQLLFRHVNPVRIVLTLAYDVPAVRQIADRNRAPVRILREKSGVKVVAYPHAPLRAVEHAKPEVKRLDRLHVHLAQCLYRQWHACFLLRQSLFKVRPRVRVEHERRGARLVRHVVVADYMVGVDIHTARISSFVSSTALSTVISSKYHVPAASLWQHSSIPIELSLRQAL